MIFPATADKWLTVHYFDFQFSSSMQLHSDSNDTETVLPNKLRTSYTKQKLLLQRVIILKNQIIDGMRSRIVIMYNRKSPGKARSVNVNHVRLASDLIHDPIMIKSDIRVDAWKFRSRTSKSPRNQADQCWHSILTKMLWMDRFQSRI